MNLLTEFKTQTLPNPDSLPVIELKGVSVRYRLPQERIPSFKEYAIRWVKRQLSYNEFWALEDVSLQVKAGEVFGIIGSNGAGKSTMLKVVARVLRPTRGAVRVRGRVAPLLELGAGFDYELTGRENIYLNGAILGHSRKHMDYRVGRIIEFAGLKDFSEAPLRTYSTGMVARLGFAIATDERPDVLIVDEILSVGDAEFQMRSFERIQSFKAEGTTILLVSHSLNVVEDVCTRALWLEHGKVVIIDDAKMVVDHYMGRVREDENQAMVAAQSAAAKPSDEPAAAADQANAEEQQPRRWGNQRLEITRSFLTNESGKEQSVFYTGEKLLLHMEYVAHEPVQSPIFGMAVYRHDGAHLTGPNSAHVDLDLGLVKGRGKVIYTVPKLPVLEGLYHITIAAVNHNDTETFDYQERPISFRVLNSGKGVKEKYGYFTFQGLWSHQPEVEQGSDLPVDL